MKIKTWSYRIVITVLLAELAYLVLFNMALHLPLTQTLINQIKPEKFSVTWEKAWTWLPFRVHRVRGSVIPGSAIPGSATPGYPL